MGPEKGKGKGVPCWARPLLNGFCLPGEVGILAPSPEEMAGVSKQTLERTGLGGKEGRGKLCFMDKLRSLFPTVWYQYQLLPMGFSMNRDNSLRDTSPRDRSPEVSARKRETYSSHSEKRNGRGSCLVSEWSPAAWEREQSLGGKARDRQERRLLSSSFFLQASMSQPPPSHHLKMLSYLVQIQEGGLGKWGAVWELPAPLKLPLG